MFLFFFVLFWFRLVVSRSNQWWKSNKKKNCTIKKTQIFYYEISPQITQKTNKKIFTLFLQILLFFLNIFLFFFLNYKTSKIIFKIFSKVQFRIKFFFFRISILWLTLINNWKFLEWIDIGHWKIFDGYYLFILRNLKELTYYLIWHLNLWFE